MAKPQKSQDEIEVLDAPDVDEVGNPTLEEAKKRSKTVKVDKLYPPKIRNMTKMNYAGKVMEDFFPEKTVKHGDFTGADLSDADFTGFNLQGSIFKGTNLTGTIFRDADLRWASFTNCTGLKGKGRADFTNANINETQGLD